MIAIAKELSFIACYSAVGSAIGPLAVATFPASTQATITLADAILGGAAFGAFRALSERVWNHPDEGRRLQPRLSSRFFSALRTLEVASVLVAGACSVLATSDFPVGVVATILSTQKIALHILVVDAISLSYLTALAPTAVLYGISFIAQAVALGSDSLSLYQSSLMIRDVSLRIINTLLSSPAIGLISPPVWIATGVIGTGLLLYALPA